jgi:hypothetical protein
MKKLEEAIKRAKLILSERRNKVRVMEKCIDKMEKSLIRKRAKQTTKLH